MKTRTWMVIAGLTLALALSVAIGGAALAQGAGGGYGMGMQGGQMMGGMRGGGMGMQGEMGMPSLITVAADKLGMTADALRAALGEGKTVAQLAAERNVALATIVDAFMAPHQARMDAAVAAGRMQRAQADTMLAIMRSNVATRLNQPWSPQGAGSVDENGDGVCDYAGGGMMGGGMMGGGMMGGGMMGRGGMMGGASQ